MMIEQIHYNIVKKAENNAKRTFIKKKDKKPYAKKGN